MSRCLTWNRPWIRATPRVAAVFAPLGTFLSTAAVFRNPALSRTLERLAVEGRPGFYEGAIGREVVDTAQRAGSHLTRIDLERYRVAVRTPLHTRYAGADVYAMPPPSAGGLLLLQALGMHTPEELSALGYGSGGYLHLLAETFRASLADRFRFVGDPNHVVVDVAALLAPARLRARRALFAPDRTRRAESFPVGDAGTSHLTTVDAEGNVVSISSSLHHMFGAKLVTPGGVVLNDQLAGFTAERLFGGPGPNAPRPGARPVSSMAPTIVVRDGQAVLALGGSGGERIATGMAQAVLAHVVFRRSAEQAVRDRRVHTPALGGLVLEPGTEEPLLADLRQRGEHVMVRPSYGAVGLVSIEHTSGPRRIEAMGDPRKGGTGRVR